MGQLYVVRHADAGTRGATDGPDELRGLTERGRHQAEGLRDRLAGAGITRLLSSPYRRCIDTLQPLADHLDLKVQPDDRLVEGGAVAPLIELIDELVGDTAALCSHGDLIPDLLETLMQMGMALDGPARWPKASTWVLTRDAESFSTAVYLPPPR